LAVAAVLALAAAGPAAAKYQYSYAVKFVCGYNPTNVGLSQHGSSEGEPTVKLGNYATDINVFNPDPHQQVDVGKQVILLVRSGFPIGREPQLQGPVAFDGIVLPPGTATMDDCNRIAELLFGNPVPTPLPLLVGFFIVQSTFELDVTAVYTAEVCSFWAVSPQKLDCLDPNGKPAGVGISIDVEQVRGRKIF
jgi:hypothetical protein